MAAHGAVVKLAASALVGGVVGALGVLAYVIFHTRTLTRTLTRTRTQTHTTRTQHARARTRTRTHTHTHHAHAPRTSHHAPRTRQKPILTTMNVAQISKYNLILN
jgi:ABC-type nickel/cobalt efflux system permease component RcnA